MAGRKKAPLWRQAFLRGLKRTGNVRVSAFEAGVDPGTAYDHRAKDPGFRAKWDDAKAAFGEKRSGPRHRHSGGPPPRSGEELVLRRTKHGDRMVRAAPGRWCSRIEESFLDGLEQTGCVETAARAAGISTAALYERRAHYPEFKARWEERVGRFREQLPGLLNAAAVKSMSPEPEGAKRRGRARLPKVGVGEAIRIYAINENAKARGSGRRGGEAPPRAELSHEELVQTLARLFGMAERRQNRARLADGWQDAGSGIWLPPGWTVQRPPAQDPSSPEAPGDEGNAGMR